MRRFATNLLGHLGRPLLNSPLASLCHRYLDLYYLHRLWRMSRRQSPHWYENRVLLHRWTKHLNPEFVEKGIQSRMALTPGCEVLDIGCGDGFYPYMFYVSLASRIDGIDLEEQAVRHAKRYHAHPKIRYFLRDAVLDEFPEADYDAILLNGALAHFSEESLALLLPKIARALRSGGVFAGYEEMETAEEKTWDHQIALPTERAFREFLSPHFRFVRTLTARKRPARAGEPWRKIAYFRCSDDAQSLDGLQFSG